MHVQIIDDASTIGRVAAAHAANVLRSALRETGQATIVVATGASQFALYDALVQEPGIDWSKLTAFHLDEYIGLPVTHPASFRAYLRERFLARLPVIPRFIAVDGDAPDLPAEILRLNGLLRGARVDLCLAGIGENGHLAFNDPPCDFETQDPYIVVDLNEACRKQQFGEGWFPSLDAVPRRAISMSIHRIMACAHLVLTVPDQRKAAATQAALEGPVSANCPASIVQRHPACTVFLDHNSASLLRQPAA